MKKFGFVSVMLTTGITILCLSSTSFSFHSGSVAECGGCHTMHNSSNGLKATTNNLITGQATLNLLRGSDASSACLDCHEAAGLSGPKSYYVSTPSGEMTGGMPPKQLTPGGDFGWLKKSYTFSDHGTVVEDGSTHGHNIVAADKGYTAVTGNSPGGSYPASKLGCGSCHDPHGKARRPSTGSFAVAAVGQVNAPIKSSGSYANSPVPSAGEAVGVYRLLAGKNYVTENVTFDTYPIAVAPNTYNQSEATNQVRVAYGASGTNTWSNWCATCHDRMHSNQNYVHPVDQSLGSKITANYNAYVKTGDMTGTSTNSYLSLVPFATNSGDFATLAALANNNNSNLSGPHANDQVNCLTCHRAHASGWMNALRWNNNTTYIVENGAWPAAQGRTVAETQKAYYDRPATVFATYQKGLCNKCHVKD
jgi:hypothetical protein